MKPLRNYLITEQEVINKFRNSDLNKMPFSVESNIEWRNGHNVFEFDIVVRYDNIPLAVVEIKQSLNNSRSMDFAKKTITRAFGFLNCKYGVITDNNDFYLFEINNRENCEKLNFDEIISKIQRVSEPKHLVIENLKQILDNNDMGEFVEKLEQQDGAIYFKDDEETLFWEKLLGTKEDCPELLYRYTTFDTAFSILKNGTYRMNGIVGMNDISEIDYFDDYCYTSKKKPSYQTLNNLFISSCCSLKDNLTMWRLYGDDAKGICLVFKIIHNANKDFMLQTVSYANDKNKNDRLDLVKKLINNKVVFNYIDKWKHFFKAFDYSIEKEVRLLFSGDIKTENRDEIGWIKTAGHSIINPYVEFDIEKSEFPLELKEIVLGPKCPEIKTNENQLKELIRFKGYDIEVKTSSIKNYR